MGFVVMEELPIAAVATVIPDSPSKDAKSVPSTDDESAYHNEEEGIEIDDVATIIAENECTNPKHDAAIVVPVNNSNVAIHQKQGKKKKRTSFLFSKKAKKSARAAAPPDELPGLVLTMSEDNVSSLTSVPKINKTLKIGKTEGEVSRENPDFSFEKSALKAAPVTNVESGSGVTNEPVQEENTDAGAWAQSNEGNIVGPGESSGLTILGIENHEAPRESKTNFVDPAVHVANIVPVTTDPGKNTKRKSLRFLSKKDSKAKNQVVTPQVVTPPSSPPSTITVKTRAPSLPVVKDDPVEDAAAGIGRKWALFFHREKGEIDEDSDDPSQEEDFLSFAVDLDRVPSPVTVKECHLEEAASAEVHKDDSKTEAAWEEVLATPAVSEEPVSLEERIVSTEAKENSSTIEASEVAPIDEPLPEETLAKLATAEPAEPEPREPTAATSPSSPKRKKWRLSPKRNKPAVIDYSGIQRDGEVYPQIAPLLDEDRSNITADTITSAEGGASIVPTSALASGKEEKPRGASSEITTSIFTPWTVAMAAFTGSIVQDTEDVEVSVATEEKNIGIETESTDAITEEESIVTADKFAEKGKQLSGEHSETTSSIFASLSAAMVALTGSVIQDSEGIEVSTTEGSKVIESDAMSTKNMDTSSSTEDVATKAHNTIEKEVSSESVAPKKLSSSKASEESSVFSCVDGYDQDAEKAEDSGAKEGNFEELEQTKDESSKSGEEQSKEGPSESVGIFASAMTAFMSAIFVSDTGDVEVSVGPEGATAESEATAMDNAKITDDFQIEASPGAAMSLTRKENVSENEATETIDVTDKTAALENNASSEDDSESVANSTRAGESPNSPSSTGVLAQRKSHLAALAASIPTLDDESKEGASSCITSPDNVAKTSFKDKLSSIIARDIAANERSAEESDGSIIKTNLKERYQLVRDSSLVDVEDSVLEREFNDFFKQLDDESVETELMDSAVSNDCIASARTRCYSPPTYRFDDREFDEGFKLKACGAVAPACQGKNVQYETEEKIAAFIENFDFENCKILAPCGRSSDAVDDKSVYSGSKVAPSEAALSDNGMKLLDNFFEETSLDETFWSALDGSTIQSRSVHSGSIRNLRKFLDDFDDKDLDDSIFDTVAERDDDESIESTGHEVDAEPRYGFPSSPDEDIEGSESILDSPSRASSAVPSNAKSKENADTAAKETKESTSICVEKDDALKSSEQKAGSKSPDKAVEDIKRAMATLKKYASRHGISEPELLWRIQEEHKKRRGFSASMAEF